MKRRYKLIIAYVVSKTILKAYKQGIYFSAHWCPPCRAFTPKLAEFYNNIKKTDIGKKMDIIFVTSDRDAGQFAEYYGEMPWLAVPFTEDSVRDDLKKKYGVRGIPFFVIIDCKTGGTITTQGREKVMNDPDNFPWK